MKYCEQLYTGACTSYRHTGLGEVTILKKESGMGGCVEGGGRNLGFLNYVYINLYKKYL